MSNGPNQSQMIQAFKAYARLKMKETMQLRGRYPWLLLCTCILPFLLFELVPHNYQTLQMALYLAGVVGTMLGCVDLLMLMRRVYVHRGDMRPLRWPMILIGSFALFICLGRMVRFMSFFLSSLYVSETIITLFSAGILIVCVLAARSAETYLLRLPKLADLKAANDEAHDATAMLHLREKLALEAMITTADNTILEANQWAYRMLEYDETKHELIGLRTHQLIHEDDHLLVYRNMQRNYPEPYVVRALTKNGGIRHILMRGASYTRTLYADLNADLIHLSTFKDITIERQYLQEIEKRRMIPPEEKADLITTQLADLRSYFTDSVPSISPSSAL